MIQDADTGGRADARDEPGEPEPGEAKAEAGGVEGPADAGSEVELLRRQAEENQEKLLRAAAELENLRKRTAREIENARRYGVEQLARALLPVRDSLEAGLASGDQADVEALLDGKRATLRLLDAALEQVGIEEVDPEGEPFDPARHEAMTLAASDTVEPDTVLSVVQKGYAIHDRLLRPARVIVAREPGEADG